jgi:hypothetical protein
VTRSGSSMKRSSPGDARGRRYVKCSSNSRTTPN